jgi:hypothetical protein
LPVGITRAQNCTGRIAEKVQRKSIIRDPDPVGEPNLNRRWELALFIPYHTTRRSALSKGSAPVLVLLLPSSARPLAWLLTTLPALLLLSYSGQIICVGSTVHLFVDYRK